MAALHQTVAEMRREGNGQGGSMSWVPSYARGCGGMRGDASVRGTAVVRHDLLYIAGKACRASAHGPQGGREWGEGGAWREGGARSPHNPLWMMVGSPRTARAASPSSVLRVLQQETAAVCTVVVPPQLFIGEARVGEQVEQVMRDVSGGRRGRERGRRRRHEGGSERGERRRGLGSISSSSIMKGRSARGGGLPFFNAVAARRRGTCAALQRRCCRRRRRHR